MDNIILSCQFDMIIEFWLARSSLILSPVRSKNHSFIQQFAPFKEITLTIYSVIIETICIQSGLTMFEYYISTGLCYLGISIIVEIISCQGDSVSL